MSVSEVKHGEFDPQARELAYDAARSHVVAAGRELGADALQALQRLSRLAHEYSRFVADLPDGAPEAVRQEGLEAYTRLLGESADSADQLAGVLAVLVDQARQPILGERMAALASDPDRLSAVLGPVPAGDERVALEGFLRARVDQANTDLAAGIRIGAVAARFAPDRVDAALDRFGASLDQAARDWADNAALRALAGRPEGRDFLREPGIDRLDDILSALARDASPQALASLPSLLAALPLMGVEAVAVRDLLENVGQFLQGEAGAYDEAVKLAAKLRVRSRGALMEFVRALHVLDSRLIDLGNRIMECSPPVDVGCPSQEDYGTLPEPLQPRGMAEDDMDSLLRQAQELQHQVASVRDQMTVLEVTGTAAGGAVAVTMTPTGEVRSLRIDDEVVAGGRAEVEETVLLALRDAADQLRQQTTERMASLQDVLRSAGRF
ncbi:YbaB/EbfC family nucleoid-associated protein [Micromonospora sp. DT4]|uniref:YbaB/EbfC family nucleoid-associated protein n=1 Tax=Micromonospora sp. DT4 TaxID=3393438 RepID=UPI003CF8EDE7